PEGSRSPKTSCKSRDRVRQRATHADRAPRGHKRPSGGGSVGPNGPDWIWGSFRRCRPGTLTRLRGSVVRPVLGAVERKVASRSGLLPEWRADAHLRTDPQLAKTCGGEQGAHVSPIPDATF